MQARIDIATNIRCAINVLEKESDKKVKLDSWRQKGWGSCNTIYCAAGLFATLPYFNDQGLDFGGIGQPCFSPELIDKWRETHEGCYYASTDDVLSYFFGWDALTRFFAARGLGDYDGDIIAEHGNRITDRELTIYRFEIGLAELTGCTNDAAS